LSHQQETTLPENLDGKISCLIEYLRASRCLLVLDNVESILSSDERAGAYRQGYEGYGHLLRCLGETNHQSCLVLTSREKPRGIRIKEGINSPIRSLRLSGLTGVQGEKILVEKGFCVSESECQSLVEFYAGNPLALKIVATTIHELFDGNAAQFLEQGTIVFGDISDLLDQQFNRLIEQLCQEIQRVEIGLFNHSCALIRATAKDYVINAQIRLILKPLADKLLNLLGTQENVQNYLNQLLSKLKSVAPRKPGYAGGNILNLLWQLDVDLSGYDFSNLTVWQAYLQKMYGKSRT
jgi:hypothetical protein